MELIIGGYLVGFIMSWMMGAAPAEFQQKELTATNNVEVIQLKQDIQEDDEDIGSLVRLGQIYTLNNYLEDADAVLDRAKQLEPEDSDILAWWGSNQTKMAGASIPWCWGICKIRALENGMAAINRAIAISPQNPTAHLVRINTLTALKGRFSDFDLVFEDERFFRQNSESFPDGMMASAYVALASAYIWKFEKEGNSDDHLQAMKYLNLAKQKDNRKDSDLPKNIEDLSRKLIQEDV